VAKKRVDLQSGWCASRTQEDPTHRRCPYLMQEANRNRAEIRCACSCHAGAGVPAGLTREFA
jgi:hypothetical protein